MSLPMISENWWSGWCSTRNASVSTVRPPPPTSRSTMLVWSQPEVSRQSASHMRTRASKGSSCLPNGWWNVGISQTASTPCVAWT